MLRNKEVFVLLISMISIGLIGTIAAAFLSLYASALVFVLSLLMIITSYLFTAWRYREIEKLSAYLRQISHGDYTLDVRDHHEGELSILKSDIYKVTLMLSEQRTMLQEDKVQLTNAISDISHQLKTPLTSMMVMADLLSDVDLPEDKRTEFTENIRSQLERIQWLVSSLLKLSKIDAGTVTFKRERIQVRKLIERAIQSVMIPIDIKEQTISIQGAEDVHYIGDFNWTAEAVINILKNCVEHTGQGGTISISYSENALYTELILKDSGKGIHRDDLPYIFKRFYKGKNAHEDSVGIGLAMAHSIISSQNGDITVESEHGQGTAFRVKFYKQII